MATKKRAELTLEMVNDINATLAPKSAEVTSIVESLRDLVEYLITSCNDCCGLFSYLQWNTDQFFEEVFNEYGDEEDHLRAILPKEKFELVKEVAEQLHGNNGWGSPINSFYEGVADIVYSDITRQDFLEQVFFKVASQVITWVGDNIPNETQLKRIHGYEAESFNPAGVMMQAEFTDIVFEWRMDHKNVFYFTFADPSIRKVTTEFVAKGKKTYTDVVDKITDVFNETQNKILLEAAKDLYAKAVDRIIEENHKELEAAKKAQEKKAKEAERARKAAEKQAKLQIKYQEDLNRIKEEAERLKKLGLKLEF